MAMAFGEVKDLEAFGLAESILSQFPDCEAAKSVVVDLSARKKRKRFGKKPEASAPKSFEAWVKAKQFGEFIARLDDVAAEQDGWPGGVALDQDWRVDGLIRIGDASIPALIDVIEKDERLTRPCTVGGWEQDVGFSGSGRPPLLRSCPF